MRPAAEDAFESFQHFTRQQLNLQKEVRPCGDSLGDGDGWLEAGKNLLKRHMSLGLFVIVIS